MSTETNDAPAKPEAGPQVLESPEHVLSTLERDGSRRWLKPRLSHGSLLMRRRIVAYLLIAIFTLVPYISIAGKPLVLLDIRNREFTILTYTFLPTDTVLLALFMVGVFLSVFLATALVGRVWCGWACPQTVYLEFLYRPIERLFEGTKGKGGQAKKEIPAWRRVAMYATYLVISMYLAHTFLAYFVGVDSLREWVFGSPFKHPIAFMVMAATTLAMMFDFCYFREQLCLIACPYGRFQSVLLDRDSLIVAYDEERGEPRGKAKKKKGLPVIDSPQGDCVDCGMCVTTCPTGIDIRKGLQMECVNCTQCIDACNAVMTKLKRPLGLIRYGSQAGMAGEKKRFLRPRVVIYPTVLLIIASLFTFLLVTKSSFDVIVLRNIGAPFIELEDGRIQNQMKLKVTNRTDQPQTYTIKPKNADAEVIVVDAEEVLEPGASYTFGFLIIVPSESIKSGKLPTELTVTSENGEERTVNFTMLGPVRR